jgi:hypothetical protein
MECSASWWHRPERRRWMTPRAGEVCASLDVRAEPGSAAGRPNTGRLRAPVHGYCQRGTGRAPWPDRGAGVPATWRHAKVVLRGVRQVVVAEQATAHVEARRRCTTCGATLRLKGHHQTQFRTPFGTVPLTSPRVFRCQCSVKAGVAPPEAPTATFSPLAELLAEHVALDTERRPPAPAGAHESAQRRTGRALPTVVPGLPCGTSRGGRRRGVDQQGGMHHKRTFSVLPPQLSQPGRFPHFHGLLPRLTR